MSLIDVVDDLITLQDLADHEDDPARRRSLDALRDRLAERDSAKVSEAAKTLGVSPPTVRAWIEAGLLEPVAGASPTRIDLRSLAVVKRAVDLLRRHRDDRYLLTQVMRLLRDNSVLANADEGFDDLRAGRLISLDDSKLDELLPNTKKASKLSKSS
jgi:transposase-like protein